jgi:RNA polymerase sigma factor (sigma-70 family)
MNPTLARLRHLVAHRPRESDGCLITLFLAGNQSAFRELVNRHASLVFGICNRILRHQQDAEDAFQAAFIVLARRAGDVWPRDAVGSWLYGVATRVALKARTLRMRRRLHEETLAANCLNDVAKPDASISKLDFDAAEAIDRAVRKLPEVYRAAVVACDLEGLSRKDAAGRLGWTEGTLSGRLARARKLLAYRLRKSGISCPALGLAAILGTGTAVRAGLSEAVMRVIVSPSAIPAPLVALTQGVVHNMFAFKLKAVMAAFLVACTVGLGAWTAGAGEDPGSQGDKGKPSAPVALGKDQGVDLSKIKLELAAIEKELLDLLIEYKAAGGNPPESVKRRINQAESKLAELRGFMAAAMAAARGQEKPSLPPVPVKLDPALNDLQGKWKIESIKEGKKAGQIDPKADFTMEITGNKLFMPYRESDGTIKRLEYKIAVDDTKNPKTIDLIRPGQPVGSGIYQFTASGTTCTLCHAAPFELKRPLPDALEVCNPGLKRAGTPPDYAIGMTLAIATDAPRPNKFEAADGVLEFKASRVGLPHRDPLADFDPNRDRVTKGLLHLEATARLNEAQRVEELARKQMLSAQAYAEQAKADFERSKALVQVAIRQLDEARARVTAFEKAVNPPTQQPAAAGNDDWITIHIRPQLSGERTLWVKLKDAQTVLDGLSHTGKELAIKPETVNVWVVRDEKVLTVDLAGIGQKGNSSTNYQLKHGDKLFVQVKVGK